MTPDRMITVAGTEYTIDGSFRTLKAIQTVFGKDILEVLMDALRLKLRFDEIEVPQGSWTRG